MLLKGKYAVVTGSNRGIGRSTVKLFAQNGATVWACARKSDDGFLDYVKGLKAETGSEIYPVFFDLAREAEVKDGAKAITSQSPGIDILVNNAAIIHTALFQMTSIEKMRELFEINYFSQLALTQILVRKMQAKRSGSIVNISSSAGIEGNEGRVAYAATKSALISSTLVLSKELAPFGIRVNTVAPGLTETEMMRESTQEEALNLTLKRTCLKRVGQPEEIASAVLFLASNLSSYMTGQVLRVDGGM